MVFRLKIDKSHNLRQLERIFIVDRDKWEKVTLPFPKSMLSNMNPISAEVYPLSCVATTVDEFKARQKKGSFTGCNFLGWRVRQDHLRWVIYYELIFSTGAYISCPTTNSTR